MIFITQIHQFFRTHFCIILDEYNPQSQRVLGYIYLIEYNNWTLTTCLSSKRFCTFTSSIKHCLTWVWSHTLLAQTSSEGTLLLRSYFATQSKYYSSLFQILLLCFETRFILTTNANCTAHSWTQPWSTLSFAHTNSSTWKVDWMYLPNSDVTFKLLKHCWSVHAEFKSKINFLVENNIGFVDLAYAYGLALELIS